MLKPRSRNFKFVSHIKPKRKSVPLLEEMRRRLHAALKEHLSDKELFKALQIWKSEFAQRSRFPQREYALAVSSRIKTSVSYDDLLDSIVNAMQADIESLPPAPTDSSLLATEDDLAPARTFGVLLSKIGKILNVEKGSELLHDVFNGLLANQFSAALASAVIRNIATDEGLTLIRIKNPDAYGRVLNIVYVAACESVGPVRADQVLSDAVMETNKGIFGKVYAANHFL